MGNNKIISQAQAYKIRQNCRRGGQIVVFTNGCFDLLHRGHVEYLVRAKKLGDILMVALNTDKSVRALKGQGRPIIKFEDRAFILAHLDAVDYVTSFASPTPRRLIARLLPDVLVKGGDYRPDEIVGAREVINAGGRVRVVPYIKGHSTSRMIGRFA
jgi:rfaE bifunctional protein nucleotidyltransferase chain/domain